MFIEEYKKLSEVKAILECKDDRIQDRMDSIDNNPNSTEEDMKLYGTLRELSWKLSDAIETIDGVMDDILCFDEV